MIHPVASTNCLPIPRFGRDEVEGSALVKKLKSNRATRSSSEGSGGPSGVAERKAAMDSSSPRHRSKRPGTEREGRALAINRAFESGRTSFLPFLSDEEDEEDKEEEDEDKEEEDDEEESRERKLRSPRRPAKTMWRE